jgi:menaquinone-specific isochorismate synthase
MPTSLHGERLVARTVSLDGPVDLTRVAGDHGVLWERPDQVSLAGRGVAARVPVDLAGESTGDQVAAVLSTIETDGPHPPVAIGALPFWPSESAYVVVPAVLVRRQPDGSCWLTVIADDPQKATDDIRRRLAAPGPDPASDRVGPREYRVGSDTARGAWCDMVAQAASAVAAGRLAKVVLARGVTVVADEALRPIEVARRLMTSHPSCMVFSVDGFVGASPELLLERTGMTVRSRPLAGTTARPGSGAGDDEIGPRLLSSSKERQEHRLVVDAVSAALSPYCDDLTVPDVPGVIPFGTLAHLGTLVTGRLRQPWPTALDLVGAIHPSPAVGGTPTAAALEYIATVEGVDRGRYAGPVGWVDAEGDGCWAVGIRSAHIEGRQARLLAGVGVVAESDPLTELAETDLKLQPMLAAIIRP